MRPIRPTVKGLYVVELDLHKLSQVDLIESKPNIISYFTIQKVLEPIDHFPFVLTTLSFIDHCAIETLILIS